MAIRIKARAGESVEQMLRRFKKLCEKEGLTKDVKRQGYYEKPSERRRRAIRKSIKRQQMLTLGIMPMKGKRMGPGGPGGMSGPGGRGPGRGPGGGGRGPGGGGRGPGGRGPAGGRGPGGGGPRKPAR